MLKNKFDNLAKKYLAVYDDYGNTLDFYKGLGYTKIPECNNFHSSYIHYAFDNNTLEPQYNWFEPIPPIENLIDFLEELCPHISTIHYFKLLQLSKYNVETERIPTQKTKIFINQYISSDDVYEFLRKYNYC
jgi:hypothetical protein